MEDLIRAWGLHDDPVIDFGAINEPYRTHLGMLQQPEQLAKALIYLSDFKIKTYLEVGTFWGSTCTFISLYLAKFNPDLKVLGIDNFHDFNQSLLELSGRIEFRKCTTNDLKGQSFDLCFIDADHSYKGVSTDYENVGKYAKICMFHDIQDEFVVKDRDKAGSKKHWNEIRNGKEVEFLEHPDGKKAMGIGIICPSR